MTRDGPVAAYVPDRGLVRPPGLPREQAVRSSSRPLASAVEGLLDVYRKEGPEAARAFAEKRLEKGSGGTTTERCLRSLVEAGDFADRLRKAALLRFVDTPSQAVGLLSHFDDDPIPPKIRPGQRVAYDEGGVKRLGHFLGKLPGCKPRAEVRDCRGGVHAVDLGKVASFVSVGAGSRARAGESGEVCGRRLSSLGPFCERRIRSIAAKSVIGALADYVATSRLDGSDYMRGLCAFSSSYVAAAWALGLSEGTTVREFAERVAKLDVFFRTPALDPCALLKEWQEKERQKLAAERIITAGHAEATGSVYARAKDSESANGRFLLVGRDRQAIARKALGLREDATESPDGSVLQMVAAYLGYEPKAAAAELKRAAKEDSQEPVYMSEALRQLGALSGSAVSVTVFKRDSRDNSVSTRSYTVSASGQEKVRAAVPENERDDSTGVAVASISPPPSQNYEALGEKLQAELRSLEAAGSRCADGLPLTMWTDVPAGISSDRGPATSRSTVARILSGVLPSGVRKGILAPSFGLIPLEASLAASVPLRLSESVSRDKIERALHRVQRSHPGAYPVLITCRSEDVGKVKEGLGGIEGLVVSARGCPQKGFSEVTAWNLYSSDTSMGELLARARHLAEGPVSVIGAPRFERWSFSSSPRQPTRAQEILAAADAAYARALPEKVVEGALSPQGLLKELTDLRSHVEPRAEQLLCPAIQGETSSLCVLFSIGCNEYDWGGVGVVEKIGAPIEESEDVTYVGKGDQIHVYRLLDLIRRFATDPPDYSVSGDGGDGERFPPGFISDVMSLRLGLASSRSLGLAQEIAREKLDLTERLKKSGVHPKEDLERLESLRSFLETGVGKIECRKREAVGRCRQGRAPLGPSPGVSNVVSIVKNRVDSHYAKPLYKTGKLYWADYSPSLYGDEGSPFDEPAAAVPNDEGEFEEEDVDYSPQWTRWGRDPGGGWRNTRAVGDVLPMQVLTFVAAQADGIRDGYLVAPLRKQDYEEFMVSGELPVDELRLRAVVAKPKLHGTPVQPQSLRPKDPETSVSAAQVAAPKTKYVCEGCSLGSLVHTQGHMTLYGLGPRQSYRIGFACRDCIEQ